MSETFVFTCVCSQQMNVRAEYLGQIGSCPACKRRAHVFPPVPDDGNRRWEFAKRILELEAVDDTVKAEELFKYGTSADDHLLKLSQRCSDNHLRAKILYRCAELLYVRVHEDPEIMRAARLGFVSGPSMGLRGACVLCWERLHWFKDRKDRRLLQNAHGLIEKADVWLRKLMYDEE